MGKKVIISACLLGEYCRYDGKTKEVNEVIKAFKDYDIIPFCPEAPVFGTPRQRISVVKIDGEKRILDIEPTSIHQRTPLVVGSRVELADFERFVQSG